MVLITPLRMARLQRGLTLDDIFVRSGGTLNSGRMSRIERGILSPSEREAAFLENLLGIDVNAACREASAVAASVSKL